MYIEIKENTLTQWADWEFEGSSYMDIEYEYFCQNQDKYKVIDGILCDISQSSEYINAQTQKQKIARELELKAQIDELDRKRIRALAEPEVKDPETGETWVQYYTKLIQDIRIEILGL